MPLEIPMKSLISKYIIRMKEIRREKIASRIRCFRILFAVYMEHVASTNTSAECMQFAVRIIRVIKTHRNELECRKLSKVPAVGNFASFSWRCFLFLGTLSLCPIPQLCHSFSPLQKSIAHIIKLAADVMAKYRRQ